jgi:low affinity Fe/Cu permease
MKMKKRPNLLERLSSGISRRAGSSGAFILAVLMIGVWLTTGPLFGFSDTWQLVINTTTTIITFLMVFLIQRSQNKDSLSIQMKLNELIASSQFASNRLIKIEDLTEEELVALERFYRELVSMSKKDKDIKMSHSVEEAMTRHQFKARGQK